MTDDLHIRPLASHEIQLAVDWAAREGWNSGLGDAACFATVDPEGFLVAELNGEPAAVISVVNYDAHFAFLGFYIVRPDVRGQGIGWKLWQAGIAHAGTRTVGLDGVLAQQANYASQGFKPSHRNIRFKGRPGAGERGQCVDIGSVPFAWIEASDARVYPAPRADFLQYWIEAPGHAGRALLREGRLAGWGVVRPALDGWKIAPLVAEDATAADAVFMALCAAAGEGDIYLDVPEPNGAAMDLAARHGLTPVFETARMYTGPIRPVELGNVYAITSLELG